MYTVNSKPVFRHEYTPLPNNDGQPQGIWFHTYAEAERERRYQFSLTDCETVAGIDALARRMGTKNRAKAVAALLNVGVAGTTVIPALRCASTLRATISLTGRSAAEIGSRWKHCGVALDRIHNALRGCKVAYHGEWGTLA